MPRSDLGMPLTMEPALVQETPFRTKKALRTAS